MWEGSSPIQTKRSLFVNSETCNHSERASFREILFEATTMNVESVSRRLFVVVLIVLCLSTSVGQEPVRFSDKPAAVQFSRGLSIYDQAAYTAALCRRLRVGRVALRDVGHQSIDWPSPEVHVPVSGTLIYLLSGEETTHGTVSFELVRDRQHAELRLEEHRKRMATDAKIERSNEETRIVRSWVMDRQLPEGEAVPAAADSVNPGVTTQSDLIEENGSRRIRETTSIFSYYRYEKGVLFESPHRELYTKRLPSAEEINALVGAAGDAGIVYLPRQIGPADRRRMLNRLEAVYGTLLQRRQNENPKLWQIRRSAGSWWLSLRKAMLNEIDYCSVIGFVPTASSPYRGELRLRPRRDSELERNIISVTSNRSRFANVVPDPAVLTIHLCTGLPDHAKALIRVIAVELNRRAEVRYSESETCDAARSLVDVLDRLAERGKVEAFVKFRRFDGIGPVIYGAIRTESGDWLMDALHRILQSEIRSIEDWHVERTERNDAQFLHVFQRQEPGASDLTTDFWIAFDDGCIWFSTGREEAYEVIQIALDRCRESDARRKLPVLTAYFDVRRWLSWSEKESSRLALLPQWLDEHDPTTVIQSLFGYDPEPREVTPLLSRAFDGREGDGLKLTIGMDGADLLIELDVEPAMIDYCVGRYLDLTEIDALKAREYRRSIEQEIDRNTLETLELLDRTLESTSRSPAADISEARE